MKRATYDFKVTKTAPQDFNPRPREEGDFCTVCKMTPVTAISIHALVKRATVKKINTVANQAISIHALVKRATANLYNDYLYFGTKYHFSDIFPQ